jgi:type III secretory pathway component EscT
MKAKKKIGTILFVVAMIFFHYHSTGHFIWALLGIKTAYPLDPVEGWWAFLKGVLPVMALWIIFFAGLASKNKNPIL